MEAFVWLLCLVSVVLLGLLGLCRRHRRRAPPSPQERSKLLQLPGHVLVHITGFLGPETLTRTRLGCRRLERLVDQSAGAILDQVLSSLFRHGHTVPSQKTSLLMQLSQTLHPKVLLLGEGEGLLFNPRSGFARRRCPQIRGKEGIQAVALGGEVLLLSFSKGRGSSLDVYSPTTDSWTSAKALPRPLIFPATVVYGDSLYVIGGYDAEQRTYSSSLLKYDLGGWRTMRTRLGTARCGAAAVEFRGILFVAGGITPGGQCTSSVECFDPQVPEAGFRPGPPMKVKRGMFQLLVCGDQLFALGSDERGLVERLDDSGLFWRDAFFVKDYSPGCVAAVVGTKLLFFGLSRGETNGSGKCWDFFSLSRRRWGSDEQDPSLFRLPSPAFKPGQAVVVPGQPVTW